MGEAITITDWITKVDYRVQKSQVTCQFIKKVSVDGKFYDTNVVRLSCGLEIHMAGFLS
ncbi:hypothetical protein [Flavobacterium sp. FlaQc-50]|uniref:hypothetical protein n=1 Tax=unclassified Flavobacterium TaxID=196869 RepID=UPI0037574110